VQDVWVSPEKGLVVIAGACLDASVLKYQIQCTTRKRVDVVSDGVPEEPPPDGQMVHLGPPQAGYGGPYPPYGGYYYGGGGGWVPTYHAPRQQYVPNEAPVWFNDDNPNGCCVMQ
jgi:hypothetical protein